MVWLLICAPLPQNEVYVAAQEGHDAALSALVAHPDIDVNKADVRKLCAAVTFISLALELHRREQSQCVFTDDFTYRCL